jgi:hypothetical protein
MKVWISTSILFHWIKLCFFQFLYIACVLCLVYAIVALWVGVVQVVLLWCIGNFLFMWAYRYGSNVCGKAYLGWAGSLRIKVQTPPPPFVILFFCVLILNTQDCISITYIMKMIAMFLTFSSTWSPYNLSLRTMFCQHTYPMLPWIIT